MTTTISGNTGVSQIQGAIVTGSNLVDGAVTAAKLSGAQSGSAPVFGCRAWCLFDGTLTGTNAPTAGGNVTSVTRNGTGDYTINFTTAMPDTNYAFFIRHAQTGSRIADDYSVTSKTSSSIRVVYLTTTNGGASWGAADSSAALSVCIFR